LFGPGQDKAFFYVFDFCQNLEFFSQNAPGVEGNVAESLGAKLFRARLDLIGAVDERMAAKTAADHEPGIRAEAADTLRNIVSAMSFDNFLVRPRRKLVERFTPAEAWHDLPEATREELAEGLAGLPSGIPPEREEAKRLDLLVLSLQLCILRQEPGFKRLRRMLVEIASALEGQASIPAIRDRLDLIQEIQTEAWWEDVTVGMLEQARKQLRDLVHLIELKKRKIVYTDFQDELGDEKTVEFETFSGGDLFEQFRRKARHFLLQHENHMAVMKLRMNRPLTAKDLEELERMLRESGIGSAADIERAKKDSEGLGLFVRSLVGLDRGAAQEAFATFIGGRTLRPAQLEFINRIIEHLTDQGAMKPERLYEPPFTHINDQGVDGVFPNEEADRIVRILEEVRLAAVA
jgi:type I restriction enzyme R subunit